MSKKDGLKTGMSGKDTVPVEIDRELIEFFKGSGNVTDTINGILREYVKGFGIDLKGIK